MRKICSLFCLILAVGFWPVACGFAAGCPVDTLAGPGPAPLADILTDYLPVDTVYGTGLRKMTVCDSEGWERKRSSIERRAKALLGQAPAVEGTLDPEILAETFREGYRELEVRFKSGTGDTVNGYLLVPDGVSAAAPAPAILAMHGTIEQGARVTVGIDKVRENRYYGMELALRGYVVLAVDIITAGQRIYPGSGPFVTEQFDRQYPGWSAMGKILSDHRRALDYLCTLSEVDNARIGAVGHSAGGYNAFFLQAFDKRLKAAVTSCGFTPMGTAASPFQFARDRWFVHFPGLRDYLRSGMVPCDMHEVMALCAPRPLFNYSARKDHIFPSWWAVDEGLKQVAKLYEVLGASDAFERVDGEGDHDFPPEVRERAYRWLDRWLGGR